MDIEPIEMWKEVRGFDSNYVVSNLGTVQNCKTGKVLKAQKNYKGYLCVSLSDQGKSKSKRVHRLVAEAFIPNPKNLPEVDHIFGNREDNKAINLRWATGSANTRNREYCRKATSKYNGVMFKHRNKKWQVNIYLDGKTKHLGIFEKETEAALAFNQFCIDNNLNRELNIIMEA